MARFEFRFGAPVVYNGRDCGALAGILLGDDPTTWNGLAVRRGAVRTSEFFVPRSLLAGADDAQIVLVAQQPAHDRARACMSSRRISQATQKVRHANDSELAQPVVAVEDERIGIAGHQIVGVPAERTRQQSVILRIAAANR